MSLLAVNFNKLDNLIDDLNDLESDYDARIGTVSSLYSSVSSIYNEFGYLTSAGTQLSGKADALEANRDRIIAFKNTLSEFRTFASDEESGLAERIFVDSDTFMDEMGITPEYEKSEWDRFCDAIYDEITAAVDAVIEIGTFIAENWSQMIVVIGETLITIAAIAAFVVAVAAVVTGSVSLIGILTIVVKGWTAFKEVTELVGDIASVQYSIEGDKERAKEAADYDARELFDDIGEGLNNKFEWDYFDEIADGLYIGLDTLELVFDIKDIFKKDPPDMIDEIKKYGEQIKEIPDKGAFAFSDDNEKYSTDYKIFNTAYDYFDSTSAIVTDAMEENGLINESSQNEFDNAVDFGSFVKDMYSDNKSMYTDLGKDGFSAFERFLMVEGNTHETLGYIIGLSED